MFRRVIVAAAGVGVTVALALSAGSATASSEAAAEKPDPAVGKSIGKQAQDKAKKYWTESRMEDAKDGALLIRDRDELSSIVEFIRGGGMTSARARERIEIAEERERLRQDQLTLDMRKSSATGIGITDDGRASGIASARDLLKFLLD